ncbi:6-phosphofructokinase [Candidatus Woesearchaeota archaeon]|nr:6-phosphofructokinase [Candidatus Woesearchaeota archaeon]
MKRILILTGGGLAPGLNSFIHHLTEYCNKQNICLLGGCNGYKSLLEPGNVISLSTEKTGIYKDRGGTFLKTSRANPFSTEDGVKRIRMFMDKNNVDGVIAVGGDDTNGVARKLAEEGIPIIGIPKSVDNDLCGTFCTIGFPTAAERISSFVSELHDHAYSHSRVQIVEMPGGKTSGWIVACAALAGAHIIIPPEKVYNLVDIVSKVKQVHDKHGYAIVAVSHEANITGLKNDTEAEDSFGIVRKAGTASDLKKNIVSSTGLDVRMCTPAHWVQCGSPNQTDRNIADMLAQKAVDMVTKNEWGMAVCLKFDKDSLNAVSTDFSEVIGKTKGEKVKTLDDNYFDFENMCVKESFFNYMEAINGGFR